MLLCLLSLLSSCVLPHHSTHHCTTLFVLGTVGPLRKDNDYSHMETTLNHVVPERWNEEFFVHTYAPFTNSTFPTTPTTNVAHHKHSTLMHNHNRHQHRQCTIQHTTTTNKNNNNTTQHSYEGPDDMPGHVKSSLVGATVTMPLTQARLARLLPPPHHSPQIWLLARTTKLSTPFPPPNK